MAGMKVAVLKETAPGETRVALTPETARKFIALGAEVAHEVDDALRAGDAGAHVSWRSRSRSTGTFSR